MVMLRKRDSTYMMVLREAQYLHGDVEEEGEQGLVVDRPADEATLVELWRSFTNDDTETDPPEEQAQFSWNNNNIGSGFPLGLENLENLEKWEGIFQSGKSQGILNRLEKSGKSQGKPHKILKNWDKLR